jgi:hypothetical protein
VSSDVMRRPACRARPSVPLRALTRSSEGSPLTGANSAHARSKVSTITERPPPDCP